MSEAVAARALADPLIAAKDVTKTFRAGGLALEGVGFAVRTGEFVSLVGPSGCGKSTLLRMVAGLIEPSAGRLTVGGQSPAKSRRGGQRVAFVFQDANLLPWRTVTGNIRVPLELQGLPKAEHAQRIGASLQLIGLSESDARKRPRMLSGGMRMRVSLARALVTSPDLLLLDEPFAALDDMLRQQLNEDLLRIWSQQRWTALFVTHNVTEAVFLSSRILLMTPAPGRIAAEIKVPFPHPRSPELRSEPEFARLCGEVSRQLREAAQ